MENKASRTRSVVGRVAMPLGACSRLLRCVPAMIRKEGSLQVVSTLVHICRRRFCRTLSWRVSRRATLHADINSPS